LIDSIGDLKLRISQAEQAEAYRNLRGSKKDQFYDTSFNKASVKMWRPAFGSLIVESEAGPVDLTAFFCGLTCLEELLVKILPLSDE